MIDFRGVKAKTAPTTASACLQLPGSRRLSHRELAQQAVAGQIEIARVERVEPERASRVAESARRSEHGLRFKGRREGRSVQ
jgi:hypothetical protein